MTVLQSSMSALEVGRRNNRLGEVDRDFRKKNVDASSDKSEEEDEKSKILKITVGTKDDGKNNCHYD